METVERGRKRVPSLGNGRESRGKEMKHGRAGGVGGRSHITPLWWRGQRGSSCRRAERHCLSRSLSPSICLSFYLSAYALRPRPLCLGFICLIAAAGDRMCVHLSHGQDKSQAVWALLALSVCFCMIVYISFYHFKRRHANEFMFRFPN